MRIIRPATSLSVRVLSSALSYTLLIALIAPFHMRRAEATTVSAPRATRKASSSAVRKSVSLRQRGVTSALKCAKSFTNAADPPKMPPR